MAGGTGKIVHQMRVAATSLIELKTVTADVLTHTKGAYTEIVASLPDDVGFVILRWGGTSTTTFDTSMLLDVAVGGAGSEVVKIPNLPVGFAGSITSTTQPAVLGLPIAIPSGSRVAARCQAIQVGGDTVSVSMDFYGDFAAILGEPASTIDILGVDTATSGCIAVAAHSTANTKGSWVEIEDSTPNAYKALAVGLSGASAAVAAVNGLLDIGVGAVASEVIVIPDVMYSITSGEIVSAVDRGVFPLENQIAAGSRIAARTQATVGSNADLEVAVLGIK